MVSWAGRSGMWGVPEQRQRAVALQVGEVDIIDTSFAASRLMLVAFPEVPKPKASIPSRGGWSPCLICTGILNRRITFAGPANAVKTGRLTLRAFNSSLMFPKICGTWGSQVEWLDHYAAVGEFQQRDVAERSPVEFA